MSCLAKRRDSTAPAVGLLEDLLELAPRRAAAVFGRNAEIKTEHKSDPETGSERWSIVIETRLPYEEADRLLRKLEDEWWLDAMPLDGSLALGLRYV